MPPKHMLANAAYFNGVKISLRKITAKIRVNIGDKCHNGITLEASSIDNAFRYKMNPRTRRTPAVKAAAECKIGIDGMPINNSKIKLRIVL